MKPSEVHAWGRTFLLYTALGFVLVALVYICQELHELNAHLRAVEREVQKNTAAQERMERLATGALKSFGSGIE